MTSFPGSPLVASGALVLIDLDASGPPRIIPFHYNPDTITRTMQVKGVGETADRSEALRLKGPPVETIKLDVEIDATDQLEFPAEAKNQAVIENGVLPELAALELIVYPTTDHLTSNNALAQAGTLEIEPMESPLTLLVWGRNRIVPVRLTDLSVTEEAFDTSLNPIRAKVSLGMRVLSVDDLGFQHPGGSVYLSYQLRKEALGRQSPQGSLGTLGIGALP